MIRAAIFDLDETIASTGHIWRHAVSATASFMGTSLDDETWALCKGRSADGIVTLLAGKVGRPVDLSVCRVILRKGVTEGFATLPVDAMPGAVELVERLSGHFRLAIASGSPAEAIETAIARLGLTDRFDAVVSSECVAAGKPAPDVFWAAADRLGMDPVECAVFEDSLFGAMAARAAGMSCFVLPSEGAGDIVVPGCRIVESWDDVRVEDVDQASPG